jgi:hypothetical protein
VKPWIFKMRLQEVGCADLVNHPKTIHSYSGVAEDGEARLARGEQQTRCAECRRYRWQWEQKACPKFKPEGGAT